jgi:hypothetical protein
MARSSVEMIKKILIMTRIGLQRQREEEGQNQEEKKKTQETEGTVVT